MKVTEAKPDLARIFSDDKLAIETRLRACVALAVLGDRRGADLMKRAIFEEVGGRKYAIRYLPSVIGDDAAAVLCDVVRRGKNRSGLAWDAMHRVSSKRAIPPVLDLLREGHCPACTDFAVECLGIDGWEPEAAIPDLIKLLERKPKTMRPLWTQQLAAKALGAIGPEAKATLTALTRLAETHAADEWAKVKFHQPEQHRNAFGQMQYSDDYFVNAICKIRGE